MSAMTDHAGVVVVTGASAGVGRATAVAFGARGAAVGLLARGEDGLAGAAADVEAAGGTALAVPTDVADSGAVERAAQRVEDELGPIDTWVNNAMTTVFAPSWEVHSDEFRRATQVTYLGQVYGTMAALRRMRPRNRGQVVNVGSALAFRAIPLQAAYCGAKFACRGFTAAVRTELLAEGSAVHVSMVHLPAVNTPQFGWCLNRLPKHPRPVPPVYAPEVAARAIVAAALRPRRQIVLGAFTHILVLFNKLAPGVADHYAATTAISSQQTDDDADRHRPVDLWKPVDDAPGTDRGARGAFGDLEGGMLTRRSLVSLPGQVVSVARAAAARARRVRDTRRVQVGRRPLRGAPTSTNTDEKEAPMGANHATEIISRWPEESRQAAQLVIDAHGEPDEATDSLLTWEGVGPWKRMTAAREFHHHAFPTPHIDSVSSYLDYQVPTGKVGELAEFDGSVVVARTAGEVSAQCHDEQANFLALNLMNDIVTGRRSVDEARSYYAREFLDVRRQQPTPYMEGLQFEATEGGSEDPGTAVLSDEDLQRAVEEGKEKQQA